MASGKSRRCRGLRTNFMIPSREVDGVKLRWIMRLRAFKGNREREVYDSKFETLGDVADALRKDLGSIHRP